MAVPGLLFREVNPMNDKLRKWLPWVMILLFIAIVYGPRWIGNLSAQSFAKSLFEHPLPENTVLVSKDAIKDGDGIYTAALLLQTDLTGEELEASYGDLELKPAKEGHTVSMDVKALTEEDLDVLKTAKLYVDGEHYWFVYVTSK